MEGATLGMRGGGGGTQRLPDDVRLPEIVEEEDGGGAGRRGREWRDGNIPVGTEERETLPAESFATSSDFASLETGYEAADDLTAVMRSLSCLLAA